MASAPSDPKPILGKVDGAGRLVAADPELERLQVEAGSRVGASLALPQLAAIARIARRLGIPVSRRALAAGKDQDVDMWVRAVPQGDEVALSMEQWSARPASPPRLAAAVTVADEKLGAKSLGWSVDGQLRLISIAPKLTRLLSGNEEELVGQPLTRLFRLEEDESGDMPLLEALTSRSAFSGQRATARGTEQDLVLSAEPSFGSDGGFAGFEGLAAEPGSSASGPVPVVDGAIHTALRAPLDSIVRSAEEMAQRSKGPIPGEYASYAADIATAARHLLAVVQALGEQSKAPSAGQVDLARLAAEAVALVDSAAIEREIAIAVQPVESFPACGEDRRITQILVNLIGNAIRYTRQGSAITISFERSKGSALVHVADEGPGIDPADHERIFEAFQRGANGSEGSGLGLSIARRLARGMGGEIRLESVPADGTRFTLELPAA
ncbi:MAG TPA: PAS domain-containing sensor histidine kinase [Sphingomicrobium sp.]|nr:PAS domain-containing sensor histidine kinase [Sphingomicrobium sp.]